MRVLSLFDGISVARLVLHELGISPTYFASEIDEDAMKVSSYHFPDVIHLGDVREHTEWKKEKLLPLDLLIGGSPCQGFSRSGKRKNFADERSSLLSYFIELRDELSPKYFLLENVRMKKEWKEKIDEMLGVEGKEIDGSLLGKGTRKRIYWTNIPYEEPEAKENMDINFDIYARGRGSASDRILRGRKKMNTVTSSYFSHNFYKLAAGSPNSFPSLSYVDMKPYLEKLEIEEIEEFLTLPRGYTYTVKSKLKREKLVGNSFHKEVVKHILSSLPF